MLPAMDTAVVPMEERWRPPLLRWVKCNTDATYYEEEIDIEKEILQRRGG
jgi:hypothetical protein